MPTSIDHEKTFDHLDTLIALLLGAGEYKDGADRLLIAFDRMCQLVARPAGNDAFASRIGARDGDAFDEEDRICAASLRCRLELLIYDAPEASPGRMELL